MEVLDFGELFCVLKNSPCGKLRGSLMGGFLARGQDTWLLSLHWDLTSGTVDQAPGGDQISCGGAISAGDSAPLEEHIQGKAHQRLWWERPALGFLPGRAVFNPCTYFNKSRHLLSTHSELSPVQAVCMHWPR